jgi:nucleolar GTP-binding protein
LQKLSFERLPHVPEPKELVNKAFRKAADAASKAKVSGTPLWVARKREGQRIAVMSETIGNELSKLVAGFPSFSNLPPFYRDLVEAIVGIDKMRKSLGAIYGTARTVEKLGREHLRRLRSARSPAEAAAVRRQAYGRISSLVERAEDHLAFLRDAATKLSDLPTIYVDVPTVVIAGYPNVGKTTLLRALTGSAPKIAPYPFTTTGLQLGYFEHRHQRYQVVDTPGLLDRPLEKRNPIERQAIAALRHLADVIIFLLDPSETCGYELSSQLSLLEDIRRTFSKLKVLVVSNKTDLLDEAAVQRVHDLCSDAFFVTATTKQGVPELLEKVLEILTTDQGESKKLKKLEARERGENEVHCHSRRRDGRLPFEGARRQDPLGSCRQAEHGLHSLRGQSRSFKDNS